MSKSKQNDLIDQEKMLILTKFLENAPFDRWSTSNLEQSAEACGFAPGYTALLFPNGVKDLTGYFHQLMNERMAAKFLKGDVPSKISEKIAYLIELKLQVYNSFRKAMQPLANYNLMPQNICRTQKFLWQSCDQIWSLAGDKSTDHNYYTKRALLSYVYTSSVMYWLSDESPNYIETKKFIAKKIQKVLKLGKWKDSALNFFKKLGE